MPTPAEELRLLLPHPQLAKQPELTLSPSAITTQDLGVFLWGDRTGIPAESMLGRAGGPGAAGLVLKSTSRHPDF